MSVGRLSTAAEIHKISLGRAGIKQGLSQVDGRITSQRKHPSLLDSGQDSPSILTLSSDIRHSNTLSRTAEYAAQFSNATAMALADLRSMAIKLEARAEDIRGGTFSPAETEGLIRDADFKAGLILNRSYAGTFLFGGTNQKGPPVIPLSTLPNYTPEDVAQGYIHLNIAQSPDLPVMTHAAVPPTVPPQPPTEASYMAVYTPSHTSDAFSWSKIDRILNHGREIKQGVSAADPAVQRLVHALVLLRSAPGLTGADREQAIEIAKTNLREAQEGFHALEAGEAFKEDTFEKTSHEHKANSKSNSVNLAKVYDVHLTAEAMLRQHLENALKVNNEILRKTAQIDQNLLS